MYTPEFRAYKNVVTEAFRKKQQEASHESWLLNPTRARIRQRCLDLSERGLAPADEAALAGYFEKEPGSNEGMAALRKSEAEDFKVLENFLGNTNINTREKNVELLAWLIDYPHRPVTVFKAVPKGEILPTSEKKAEEEVSIDGPGTESGATETKTPPTTLFSPPKADPGSGRKVPLRLAGALVVLLAGSVIVWSSFNRDECMYWNDDHYVASPCSVPRMDTPMVALDRARLKGFHRIRQVDTLTPYAIGRLWFVRVGDKLEIYTGSGRHPLYPDKQLKKVTDYAVNVCRNQH